METMTAQARCECGGFLASQGFGHSRTLRCSRCGGGHPFPEHYVEVEGQAFQVPIEGGEVGFGGSRQVAAAISATGSGYVHCGCGAQLRWSTVRFSRGGGAGVVTFRPA